jgi:hypothetical protein
MNIYLAARHDRLPEIQYYAKDLEDLGHRITSRWLRGQHNVRVYGPSGIVAMGAAWAEAEEEWADLRAADICISFTEPPPDVPGKATIEGHGGRHVLLGLALALGKTCITVGYRENGFHWLPQIEFYATWAECLLALT